VKGPVVLVSRQFKRDRKKSGGESGDWRAIGRGERSLMACCPCALRSNGQAHPSERSVEMDVKKGEGKGGRSIMLESKIVLLF